MWSSAGRCTAMCGEGSKGHGRWEVRTPTGRRHLQCIACVLVLGPKASPPACLARVCVRERETERECVWRLVYHAQVVCFAARLAPDRSMTGDPTTVLYTTLAHLPTCSNTIELYTRRCRLPASTQRRLDTYTRACWYTGPRPRALSPRRNPTL
jgi:hypothetical protein